MYSFSIPSTTFGYISDEGHHSYLQSDFNEVEGHHSYLQSDFNEVEDYTISADKDKEEIEYDIYQVKERDQE